MGRLSEFCFDTETTSLSTLDAELVGLAISYEKGTAPPEDRGTTQEIINEFKSILKMKGLQKLVKTLNMIFKFCAIMILGSRVKYLILLAHYLIDPEQSHGMDALAEAYLNYVPVSITKLIGPRGKVKNMREVPLEDITEYAGEDADITFQLEEVSHRD